MTTPRLRLFGASLFAAAAAACGNLDGHTDTPSLLASVGGQLQANADPTDPAPKNVHIAVIWEARGPGVYHVAQDLPVQPVFPSQYTLQLRDPPPAEAIIQSGGDYSYLGAATGVIVAYEDLNGNGQLDLVAPNAPAFIDRVLATNDSMALVYLTSTTGSLPSFVEDLPGHPTLGYNLLTRSCTPVDGGLTGPDGGTCDWNVVLPLDTPYDLPFSDDPKLATLMCNGVGGAMLGGGTGPGAAGMGGSVSGTGWDVTQQGDPPGGYPPAGATNFTCRPDGQEYMLTLSCTTRQTDLCGGSETDCMDLSVYVDNGAPKPAGWPCP